MTNAQLTLIVKLAGGLNEAGEAAKAAGYITLTRSNRKDRESALLNGVTTAEASALIESLGGRKLAPAGTRDNLVSEGQEVDGYMIDRGEDN